MALHRCTDELPPFLRVVLPDAGRRNATGVDLAVSVARSLPSCRLWTDIGGRAARGFAAPGRGPEPATGRAAVGQCSAVDPRRRDRDGSVRRSLVHVRVDQVLL